MANLAAQNQQLVNASALVVSVPGQPAVEDLLISAISVTSQAGTENQNTPFRVAGYFDTAGGFTLSFTSNQSADLSGPPWQQLSDAKTLFSLDVFDLQVANGVATPVASQRYNGCRCVVNTTHDAPKQFDVTVTATSRDPVVALVQTA